MGSGASVQRASTWLALFAAACLVALLGCDDYAIPLMHGEDLSISVAPPASSAPAPPPPVFVKAGRTKVRGHWMIVPEGLDARDGRYDLAIHFHGNPKVVEESYALARIRAVLVIVNLGEGADRYSEAFPNPLRLRTIINTVGEELQTRGMAKPELRRLALSAWSAGFGAIGEIIRQPEHRRALDAVLLFDGLHARYIPDTKRVEPIEVGAWIDLAKDAMKDQVLFLVTHSAIHPVNLEIAGVRETINAVLDEVGVKRTKTEGRVRPRKLEAIRGVYGDKSLFELNAQNVAVDKGLMVIEYDGRMPEHHIAHLLQMSQIGLPRLALRWKRPPPR